MATTTTTTTTTRATTTRATTRATTPTRRRAARARVARATREDDADAARAMRAAMRAPDATPDADAVAATLCELAEQEFGLANVAFAEVMAKLDALYDFAPTAYASGVGTTRETRNPAGTNSGSCKTFYFAKMRGLSEAAALRLFCEHYEDVARTPEGTSHANIRAFAENGYAGLTFDGEALTPKGARGGDNHDI